MSQSPVIPVKHQVKISGRGAGKALLSERQAANNSNVNRASQQPMANMFF